MTNVKKTLSVLLAFVLVLGTCMFSAFAAGTDTATITVEAPATANVGDTITVSVKLNASYNVASTSAIVNFNTADFELVANSLKLNDTLFGANKLATDAVAYNDAQGVVGAYFVAKKGAQYEAKKDVVLFSFQLKALKANAKADLTLPEAELKSTTKPDGKIYCGKGDATDNIVEVPCTIALTNAAVNIGGGAPVETKLVGKAGSFGGESSTGVVDEANHYLYGIVPGADPALFFEMSDGTPVTFTANAVGATNGTGATVTVGETVYTLVVFGDVDGNGAISGTDSLKIEQYAGGNQNVISGAVEIFAADVDNNTAVSGTDALKVEQYAGGNRSAITQTR